jgi:hypothetical protein
VSIGRRGLAPHPGHPGHLERLVPAQPEDARPGGRRDRHSGRIQLVGVDNLGNIWQSAQTSANAGTWSPWSQLDGQLRPDPYGW